MHWRNQSCCAERDAGGMMEGSAFLAVDWGTTNRRVYRIAADGSVEATERDDHGILSIEQGGFPAEAAAIRARMGDLPMLCAGMVGSNRGWAELSYAPCPNGIEQLSSAVHWVEPGRTAIVPGVACFGDSRADVMRGEEVQLLGAVIGGLTPRDALLCQPGTHCKWAWMVDGRIDRFVTAMTGEIFSLLQRHSLLAAQMDGQVEANAAFLRGVADARDGDLLVRLFGVRADFVTGRAVDADATSYVSGLLIGADVAARLGEGAQPVYLLADPMLGALYSAAIEAVGGTAILVDSHAAFIHGIAYIWRTLS
jgi:2-dehydro-3-deoxygalactonokinase